MGEKIVAIEKVILTCERCGKEWEKRKGEGLPIQCPKCKSHYWNKKKQNKIKIPKIYL